MMSHLIANLVIQCSSLFLATLDAEKCFDSICHVSLFLKLIDVLPTYPWLLLYNWYRKLNAVVKWNGCYSKTFDITRGTRHRSKLSPYLVNIFINQLLLDLNDCDVGVRIGYALYNYMAYADDITELSTNAKYLQCLIDMCTMYSDRWRFKYGMDKWSKCMIIGKSPFTSEPVQRLNDVRQSFYGLNSLGMSYSGAAPEVLAHLYKSTCQPVLTYGMECMSNSKDQFRRMESIQGRLIKQCLGLSKRSHNWAVLKALNIDKVQNIVNRNLLNLYHRIFKIDSPARSLMQFLLARYITYGTTVPGTLLDRVVSIGEYGIYFSGSCNGGVLPMCQILKFVLLCVVRSLGPFHWTSLGDVSFWNRLFLFSFEMDPVVFYGKTIIMFRE